MDISRPERYVTRETGVAAADGAGHGGLTEDGRGEGWMSCMERLGLWGGGGGGWSGGNAA